MNTTRLAQAALALALAVDVGAAAAADPFAGVEIDTSADHVTVVCSTCPTPRTSDDDTHRGGVGAASALYAAGDVGWGVGAIAAFAADGLPSLGVFTFAEVVTLAVGGNLYQAFAAAQGLQRYDYLGTTAATYTLSFAVEGRFTLGAADAGSPVEVFGGYTVFGSDFHPVGETHGTVLGSSFVSQHASSGGVSPFLLPGGFSFTVRPGDFFYVQGTMTAISVTNVAHQTNGTVDALHTMTGHFTGGDTALIAPAIAAVPELPTLPLLAAGMLVIGWLRRQRSDRTGDRGT